MHRSGLALAGAQTTIEAWKRGEVPPVENDGILTAEDVSTLGNAPEALAEVQRNWLVKLRAAKGLAQAVSLAGPFIMSSQGKP